MTDEEYLDGGFGGPVHRVGGTVRRRSGPWTPAVQALLRHVRDNGFDLAPAPLGVDDFGREAVSFIDGEVLLDPLPEWAWQDAVLVEVGSALRRLHDATEGFPLDEDQWRLAPAEPREVVCHNDFAPYNLVFRERHLAGVIDWDFAAPGPRARDAAYTAYRFVPLTAPSNPDAPYPGLVEQRRRLRLFCDSYGGLDQLGVVDQVLVRLEEGIARVVGGAEGDESEREPFRLGHHYIYERDLGYVRSNAAAWLRLFRIGSRAGQADVPLAGVLRRYVRRKMALPTSISARSGR